MARRSYAKPIYKAAQEWKARCLTRDASVFYPGAALWTLEHLSALRTAFTEHPELGSDEFLVKFQRQLHGQPPEVIQLAAEMLWVLFLFP
ncbi:MAG TPA: hypothetical protein VFX98_18240, partial [Longimicrobiaceae bacterium]|nr:hypothetical protein [Longimicrobiaceae bacterium]